jgi:hypothetical protein
LGATSGANNQLEPMQQSQVRTTPHQPHQSIPGLPVQRAENVTQAHSARGATALTARGRNPQQLSAFSNLAAPATDNLVSAEEEQLAGFHERHLMQLRSLGVKPKDVRFMYKLTYGDNGSRTSSRIVTHLEQPVYGVNFNTGEFVPWAMNTTVVPLYMVSVFALAGSVVPRLKFADLYAKYFKAITAVNDVIVTDLPEHTIAIKRLLEIHVSGASDFLMHFYASHRIDTGNRLSAKVFLRGWRDL